MEKVHEKTKELIKEFEGEAGNFTQGNNENLDLQLSKVYNFKVDELVQFIKNLNFEISDRK